MKHKVAISKPTIMNHYFQWIYLDSKQHPPSAMGKVQRMETFPKGKTPIGGYPSCGRLLWESPRASSL
jgi:hypothetical protein